MSERDLKAMIDRASAFAELWFADHGTVMGFYHMVKADGKELVVPKPLPEKKEVSAAIMRDAFAKFQVVRYCYTDEVWIRTLKKGEDVDQVMRDGLHDDPSAEEVIMFTAEDHERQLFARRAIIRDGAKATLGPLVMDEETTQSKGRAVGMLRPPGSLQ